MERDVIEVNSIRTCFGSQIVHRNISFSIKTGQIVALIGGSGCGKSVLLREIIRLQHPSDGEIYLFGQDVWKANDSQMNQLRERFGVLFQNSALFSSLTVAQNIAVPLLEQGKFDKEFILEIVKLRLALSGLSLQVASKKPSELSGGMKKRVALARALALEPELVFLDEPTSGLDPVSARSFDSLVRTLCDSLNLTVFMVTHDLDSIEGIADRIIVLGDGVVIADGDLESVKNVEHPWIQEYFSTRP